jgi:hypothetical protein
MGEERRQRQQRQQRQRGLRVGPPRPPRQRFAPRASSPYRTLATRAPFQLAFAAFIVIWVGSMMWLFAPIDMVWVWGWAAGGACGLAALAGVEIGVRREELRAWVWEGQRW